MNTNNMTSYKVAHRLIPAVTFESNVTLLDPIKESMPNVPNLKQWNYDTFTNMNYGFKVNTVDPMQRPTRMHLDQLNYMMPQWEKYWLNLPKPMSMPQTEYNDKHINPKLMTNIEQTPTPIVYIRSKPVARKETIMMQAPKVSEISVIRKMDPYMSTQKLDYIKINPIVAKQINVKLSKQKQILPEYESFYNEPIFNQKNKIRLLPNTMKFVPHNGLRSETSASYKKPLNTLSRFDNVVEMPISVSRNPTLAQILSVPGMYTSEYSKIGNIYRT